VNASSELWDWRRRTGNLYHAIREAADPMVACTLWRSERDLMFRTHPQSPIEPEARADFSGLRFYRYEPSLRFLVRLRNIQSTVQEQVAAGEDGVVRLSAFARTDGLAGALGSELTLYWIIGYGGGVFLPFADETNGAESYGGGRYLLDTIKGADLGTAPDGRIILDFNFAYSPSCAYSARWVCPLPPPANRLLTSVTAGERLASSSP
jgi:uncharacterized protein (DUF1684 family)